MLTVKELCEYLKMHRNTIYRLIKKGLPNINATGQFRFNLDEVLEWMKKNSKLK